MSENLSRKSTSSEKSTQPGKNWVDRAFAVLGWIALLGASFGLSYLATILLVKALVALNVPLGSLNQSLLGLVLSVLTYVMFGAVLIGFPWLVLKIKSTWQDLGYAQKVAWKNLIVLPGAVLVYVLISVTLAAVFMNIPGYDAEQVQEVGFQGMTHGYEYVAAFITLVVIAPIVEETLFRGFMHTRIRRLTGRFGAVVIVALLFGAVHMQPNVSIDTFALGLVLGVLREYTGSIYSGIAIHMAKNGVAYYLLFINPNILQSLQ